MDKVGNFDFVLRICTLLFGTCEPCLRSIAVGGDIAQRRQLRLRFRITSRFGRFSAAARLLPECIKLAC